MNANKTPAHIGGNPLAWVPFRVTDRRLVLDSKGKQDQLLHTSRQFRTAVLGFIRVSRSFAALLGLNTRVEENHG